MPALSFNTLQLSTRAMKMSCKQSMTHCLLSASVFVHMVLLVLLIVPTSASTYDEEISLKLYRRGIRAWTPPYETDTKSTIFKDVKAQGDSLYAGDGDTLIANPKKVAIIGGGFAGVSLAHYFKPDEWPDVHATVFERESYLGGRARTVMSYDNYLDRGKDVTTGGGEFDRDDRTVKYHARKVGVDLLEASDGEHELPSHVSVWDGDELRMNGFNIRDSHNPRLTSMIMKHGISLKFWWLLAEKTWNYNQYDYYERTDHLKWQRIKESVAKKLNEQHVDPEQNELTRLSTELGIQIPGQGLKVGGGNERFLKRMLRMSGSTLHLNSTVTRIKRYADLTFDLHWRYQNSNGSVTEHIDHFDAIIIAAPFHQSGIEIEPPLQAPPEEVLYRPAHVTNVVSRRELDPESFNLQEKEVPNLIWASKGTRQNSKPNISPPFLSIQRQYLSRLVGCEVEYDNLYQIVSEQPLSDDDIAKLFRKDGVARENVAFPDQSCYHLAQSQSLASTWPGIREQYAEKYEEYWNERLSPEARDCDAELEECQPRNSGQSFEESVGCRIYPHIRWIHRQSWDHGLPIVDSNRSEASIELVPRLFYVNGFEGRNGASLSGSLRNATAVLRALSWDYCGGRL